MWERIHRMMALPFVPDVLLECLIREGDKLFVFHVVLAPINRWRVSPVVCRVLKDMLNRCQLSRCAICVQLGFMRRRWVL